MGQPPVPLEDWVAGAIREAEALEQGKFLYFSWQWGELGYPRPDWFLNPFTGQRDPAQGHWCDRRDFDPNRGDVKYIWEPSRFRWAYALARAYSVRHDDRFAGLFWRLFESWTADNPPHMGPNWMCGQEIAIRAMACVFAAYAFERSPATTDERFASLVVFLAASAERISGNINYARAQMGNHAVSEAAGIWTIGTLFPQLAQAEAWRRRGLCVLEDEVRRYNFADGSYTQHSMNYQRLMLHSYLWCMALCERNGQGFSDLARERLQSSYRFLHELQDPYTGRLPNYGPNDGANVLPLDDCEYPDYRPVIGAMHYLFTRERLYEPGPWCEDLLWLFGPGALESPVRPQPRASRRFLDGGYFTLRSDESWGMVRCHSYRNRPNQADMLHFDLWWRGVNVLRDSGSFSYYDPQSHWNHFFLSTAAHNTVMVNEVDQMIKGPRFQWYSLVRSRWIDHGTRNHEEFWMGEHYGYRRLQGRVTHRRTIRRFGNAWWLIVDDILGKGQAEAALHWHLADYPYERRDSTISLDAPDGRCAVWLDCRAGKWEWGVHRGVDEAGLRLGWDSLYYGSRVPAPTIRVAGRGTLPIRFTTLVGLGAVPADVRIDPDGEISWRDEKDDVTFKAAWAPRSDVQTKRDGDGCASQF